MQGEIPMSTVDRSMPPTISALNHPGVTPEVPAETNEQIAGLVVGSVQLRVDFKKVEELHNKLQSLEEKMQGVQREYEALHATSPLDERVTLMQRWTALNEEKNSIEKEIKALQNL